MAGDTAKPVDSGDPGSLGDRPGHIRLVHHRSATDEYWHTMVGAPYPIIVANVQTNEWPGSFHLQ